MLNNSAAQFPGIGLLQNYRRTARQHGIEAVANTADMKQWHGHQVDAAVTKAPHLGTVTLMK